MRICLVTPYDPFPPQVDHADAHLGGVERVFAEVSRRLAGEGHDVEVVCSSQRPNTTGAELGINGLHVERVRRTGTIMRTPVAALAPRIPGDADVVHVAATYPFTTPSTLRRAHDMEVPCVLDFHFEPDPVTPMGRAAARIYRMIGPASYRLADKVMVRSYSYGRSAQSLAAVPEDRWRIVPNGIDPERFRPDGPSQGGGHLLFVGRLVPYKGIATLLHALALMPSPPPLLLVGEGPLRAPLESLARRLDVAARFLGKVDDEELPALYRGARLTVLPSVGQQECFGITLLESMASGTPVVASDIPGVRDVATLGGLLAPEGDPVGLAQQIRRALDDDALPRGAALAARVRSEYSWDAVTRRVAKVYEEAAGETVLVPAR